MVIDRHLNELIELLLAVKTKAEMEDFLLGIFPYDSPMNIIRIAD